MAQARYEEASSLFDRSLTIRTRFFGPDHHSVATTLCGQAEVAVAQGNDAEAAPIFQRALDIRQQKLGVDHPAVALLIEKYAPLLHRADRQGRGGLALEAKAREIRIKHKHVDAVGDH